MTYTYTPDGIVRDGVNILEPLTVVTSISDPNGQAAQGSRVPRLNENWQQSANAHWIRSSDLSVYPGLFTITGSWAPGDIAKVRVNTGGVDYDFAHTVAPGGAAAGVIATALRNVMAAHSAFTSLPMYVPDNGGGATFGFTGLYASLPTVVSNQSTTAAGTMTLVQPENLLDGPVGLHIQRLSPGRAPRANDNIGGVLFWGPYNSGGNGVTYARIDTFIDNPSSADLAGRMHFLTGDGSVVDSKLRMVLRKGLYLVNPAGAAPAGGVNGDMGAGTINTPADGGYHLNGNGYLRYRQSDNCIQLFSKGTRPLVIGTNEQPALLIDPSNNRTTFLNAATIFGVQQDANTQLIVDNSAVSGGYNAIVRLKNSAREWLISGSGAASGLDASGTLGIFDQTAIAWRFVINPAGNIGIGGNLTPTAQLSFAPSTTARALANLPVGPAPSNPCDGDIWREASGLKMRDGGATRTITMH